MLSNYENDYYIFSNILIKKQKSALLFLLFFMFVCELRLVNVPTYMAIPKKEKRRERN